MTNSTAPMGITDCVTWVLIQGRLISVSPSRTTSTM